jgi:hypothetical protein
VVITASTAEITLTDKTIAVLGGTGPQGRGLSRRFAQAGLSVVLGGRSAERSAHTAAQLSQEIGVDLRGTDNASAARQADIALVVVPWHGHAELLTELKTVLTGKVVVDCVNPLGFDKYGAYALEVAEGSATEQAAAILTDSTVVGAFHNVSAALLEDPEVESLDTDVLVLGDAREATDLVQTLAATIPGVRGVYGGRLRNAQPVEAMTANLININRRYKSHAGVRVTDLRVEVEGHGNAAAEATAVRGVSRDWIEELLTP